LISVVTVSVPFRHVFLSTCVFVYFQDGRNHINLESHTHSLFYFIFNFYPRDAMLARVIEIATCLSVRPSVRPSRAGIVSKKASGMISSPSGSPKTLVF